MVDAGRRTPGGGGRGRGGLDRRRLLPLHCAAMSEIPQIAVDEARRRLDAGGTLFMDVRDPASFKAAHVPGAVHVNDHNIEAFVQATPKDRPIVIYCYHGLSSLGGAAFLGEHGFVDVCSLSGGFEAWRGRHPHEAGGTS